MADYVVGVDVGTTGSKAMVVDPRGNVLGRGYREYALSYPRPDWVEVRADYLIALTFEAVAEAVRTSAVPPEEIRAVSFSLNRSTFGLVDEELRVIDDRLLVWLDARAESVMEEINARIGADRRNEITGMPGGNIFAVAKLYWLMKNEPDTYARARYFAPLDSIVMRAFGAADFAAELSNATACGLIDVRTSDWSREVIDALGFDREKFPPLVPSCTVVGRVDRAVSEKTGLPVGCRIVSGSGDQQVSAMGAGVIRDGAASLTIGTFGLLAIGMAKPDFPRFHGMMLPLTPRKGVFQLEGPQVSGATCYRWCRDVLCAEDRAEAERRGVDPYQLMGERYIRKARPGCGGVLFYSALFGSGYPTWDTQATGMFLGLRSTTEKADLVRAVMEGITLESRNILESIEATGARIDGVLTVTGGASKSPDWCRIIADVLGRSIRTLDVPDSAIIGAAGLAAVGAGIYADPEEAVAQMVRFGETVDPQPANREVYARLFAAYRSAYAGLKEQNVFAQLAAFRK